MSLVEEIQAGAIDRDVPVADLLRRVKLAAAKLKLADTLEWVECESNGYTCADADIPKYRIAFGRVMETSPFHGTRVAQGDPETLSFMSMAIFREGIGAMESLLNQPTNGTVMLPINREFERALARRGNHARYSVYFGLNVIVGVVDCVRNLVLDWAIKLESEGILGEGVSFTMDEKQKAAEAASNVQIYNFGHLHQGDTHGHQNRTTIGGVDASTNSLSMDVFQQLQTAISDIDSASDRDLLLELVKQMNAKRGEGGFKEAYARFIASAANYMTIISPFLPALTSYL